MFSIPPTPKYYRLFAIFSLLYSVLFDMSSDKVCMLKTKDEDKEEGEVSPELPKVLQKVVAQESRPLLPSPTSPSLPLFSKSSLPPLLPHLSSTCSDIPVVCGVNNVVGGKTDASQDGQADASQDGQAHSISKVLLCAISPWLASLIEGIPCLLEVLSNSRIYHFCLLFWFLHTINFSCRCRAQFGSLLPRPLQN